jgi:hypothetical protein
MKDLLTQPSFLVAALLSLVLGEGILCFFIIRLFHKSQSIAARQATLFQGNGAKSLENVILKQSDDMATMDKEIQELFEISNRIHRLALRSIHKVGVVRFNPFKEVGSNQSFAIALLDSKNSGTVISSLHTREGSRVYAKPVENGDSKLYPLTDEEKQAILLAQQQTATPQK